MRIFQDDSLTQGQRLVWFAVRELSSGGLAPDNCSQIAGHMNSARSHVSRALAALEEAGWIERSDGLIAVQEGTQRDYETQNRDSQSQSPTESGCDSHTRDRDSQSRDSQSRKGFPSPPLDFPQERISFNPHSEPHPIPSQREGESEDSPPWMGRVLESESWMAEPIPGDHPVHWDHLPGEWTYDFAAAALEHLQQLDLLASPTKRKIDRDGEGYVVAQWADTFRLLHQQDEYSRDEIKATMQWLFQGGNFWIQNQAIRSVPPLRSKVKSGDAYKFDIMYQQAHSDNDHTSEDAKQRPAENHQRILEAARSA